MHKDDFEAEPQFRAKKTPARRLKRRVRKKMTGISFNRLIPNLLTMLGLCAGLTGMHFATNGDFQHAVISLLIAAFLDGLDGRIARMLGGSTRFGAEFDSLSDFVCFGVTPAFILYFWALKDGGYNAFLPCLFFIVCMALRLARFNSMLDDENTKPKYTSGFFTGVPAPAGAFIVLFPLLTGLEAERLNLHGLLNISRNPYVVSATLIAIALLLVSTLPVWSFKNFKVPKYYALPIMLGTGIFAVLMVANTWATLAAGDLMYLSLIPMSLASYKRLKHEAENLHITSEEDDLLSE